MRKPCRAPLQVAPQTTSRHLPSNLFVSGGFVWGIAHLHMGSQERLLGRHTICNAIASLLPVMFSIDGQSW